MKRIFIILGLFILTLNNYGQQEGEFDYLEVNEEFKVRDTTIIDLIEEHTSGASVGAENGLTKTGSNIGLDGALIRDTEIQGAGYVLDLGTTLSRIGNFVVHSTDSYIDASSELTLLVGGVEWVFDGVYFISDGGDTLMTNNLVDAKILASLPYTPFNFNYTYSTTITDSRPGVGFFRLNNATYSNVTEIYLDNFDINSVDKSDYLERPDTGTYVSITDGTNYINYQLTGALTAASSYYKYEVTYESHSGVISGACTISLDLSNSVGGSGGLTNRLANATDTITLVDDTLSMPEQVLDAAVVVTDSIKNKTSAGLAIQSTSDVTVSATGSYAQIQSTNGGFSSLNLNNGDIVSLVDNDIGFRSTSGQVVFDSDSDTIKFISGSDTTYIIDEKLYSEILEAITISSRSITIDSVIIGEDGVFINQDFGDMFLYSSGGDVIHLGDDGGSGMFLNTQDGDIDIRSGNNVNIRSLTSVYEIVGDTMFMEQEKLKLEALLIGKSIIISDTTSSTFVINNALSNYRHVILTGGTYTVDSTILIPSNTRFSISKGTTLTLSSDVRTDSIWLMTNSDTANGNENIVIDGGGIIDGNESGRILITNEPPYTGQTACFMRVSNFKIRDLKFQNSLRFNLQISDVTDFEVDNITVKYTLPRTNDGIHITGPAKRGVIKNIYGGSNEDLIAVLANDWDNFVVTEGDVNNITIQNVYADSTNTGGIRLLNEDNSTKNIHIKDIYGKFPDTFVNLSIYKPVVVGEYDNIKVENIFYNEGDTVGNVVSTNDSAIINNLYINGVYGGKVEKIINVGDWNEIDNININNVQCGVAYTSTGLNYINTNTSINRLKFDNINLSENFSNFLVGFSTTTIKDLIFTDILIDTCQYFFNQLLMTVDNLLIDGLKIKDFNNNFISYSTGTITKSIFNNIDITSSAGTANALSFSGATVDTVYIKNSRFENLLTPLNINIAGVFELSNIKVYDCTSALRIQSTSSDVRITYKDSKFGAPKTTSMYMYINNADVDYLEMTNIEIDSTQHFISSNGTNTLDYMNISNITYSQSGAYNAIDNFGTSLTITTAIFNNFNILSNNVVSFLNCRTNTTDIENFSLLNSNFLKIRQIINAEPSTDITNVSINNNTLGDILIGNSPVDNLGTIDNLNLSNNVFKYISNNSGNNLIKNTGTITDINLHANNTLNAHKLVYGLTGSEQSNITISNNFSNTINNLAKFNATISDGFSIYASGNHLTSLNDTIFEFDSIVSPTSCYLNFNSSKVYDLVDVYRNNNTASCLLNTSIITPDNIFLNENPVIKEYEAHAYVPFDSTITTSLTTSWIFLGSGGNNKFINDVANGFSSDGDTLYFNPPASENRDSIEFVLNYDGLSATSSVNKDVFIGIFIKSIGGSYIEKKSFTKTSRTSSASVYYSGPLCTAAPIWLKDGDKIQIRAKCGTTTTTLSTTSFGIYLRER